MRTEFGSRLLSLIVSLSFVLLSPAAFAALGFSDPEALNTDAELQLDFDDSPDVVSDGQGTWVAAWHNYRGAFFNEISDILVARSTDNGATWTAETPLNTDLDSNNISPVLAADGAGNWVAVWTLLENATTGDDYDILVSRSADNGANWTAPATLSPDFGYSPVVATDRQGNWVAAWEGGDSDFDILVSRSTNNGANWTAPASLNTNAATDSGNDQGPIVATDGQGNWTAAWYSDDTLGDTIGSDDDILVARSTDNGATWTAPAPLNTNAATDSGDDDFPDVATDGAGNWVAAWHSTDTLGGTTSGYGDILVARSTDNGATWTAPAPLNTSAGTINPVVATDGAGNWVAAWSSADTLGGTIGGDGDILMACSTNNGLTWTAPAPLNTNAGTDSGYDSWPVVATDGAGGHWVAIWHSFDFLGGTSGTDGTIVVAMAPAPTGSLTLLAPNGGENWKLGTKHKIKWLSTGKVGTNVKLELVRKGGVVKVIKASTADDGAQAWIVPLDVTPRKGYKVRVTSTSDAAIKDTSDAPFRIGN